MIRLIVSDVDGTLLGSDHKLPECNLQAIKKIKEKGIPFALASGRSHSVLMRLASQYGISDYIDFYIGYNGISITEEGILDSFDEEYLCADEMKAITSLLSDLDVNFAVHDGDTLIASGTDAYVELERKLNGYTLALRENFANWINGRYPKLMIIGSPENLDRAEVILSKAGNINADHLRSFPFFLEVLRKGSSKGWLLKRYCERKGIEREGVIAIGDNMNDLSMISYAGIGVSMGNAGGKIKEAADIVTDSNDNCGFAKAVNHVLDLYDELKREEKATFTGWDFSHLDGRLGSESLPWDYRDIVLDNLNDEMTLLDMGTGGGEFLLGLNHPYEKTYVTESYEPNIKLIEKTLSPLGIKVNEKMDDKTFDIIINRHESFDLAKVCRLLKTNGLFITQQVGIENNLDMSMRITPERVPETDNRFEDEITKAESLGFQVIKSEKASSRLRFMDMGALVYFMKIIEWEFPGFSVDTHFEKLVRLNEELKATGYLESTEERYLLMLRKR